LKKSENERKEIYIFTDLAQTAWLAEAPAHWQQRFKTVEGMGFYVIDVGIDKPKQHGARAICDCPPRCSPATVRWRSDAKCRP